MKVCRHCGEDDPINFYSSINAYECKKCFTKRTSQAVIQNKKRALAYMGEKCSRCGYSKYAGALHFHHVNPEDKHPNYRRMLKWSWERQKEELDKCVLLCANCHAEEHGTTSRV